MSHPNSVSKHLKSLNVSVMEAIYLSVEIPNWVKVYMKYI